MLITSSLRHNVLSFRMGSYIQSVEHVLSGHPQGMMGLIQFDCLIQVPQKRSIRKKMPCFVINDHLIYNNLFKNNAYIDFGRQTIGFNFIWKIILILFQWLHFKRTLKNQFEGNTKGHWDLGKVNKTAL